MNSKLAAALADFIANEIQEAKPTWDVKRRLDPRQEIDQTKDAELSFSPGLVNEGTPAAMQQPGLPADRIMIRGELELFYRFRWRLIGKTLDEGFDLHVDKEDWLRQWLESREVLEVDGVTFLFDQAMGSVELESGRRGTLIFGGRVLFHYDRKRTKKRPI